MAPEGVNNIFENKIPNKDQSNYSTDFINRSQNHVDQPFQILNHNSKNRNGQIAQPLHPQPQGVAHTAQEGLPVINNTPRNPNNISNIVQQAAPVCQPQNQYQNNRNFSEIPHEGINQISENIFYISTGCCFKIFPFLFFIIGVGICLISFFSTIWLLIFGAIFVIVGIFLFFKMYNSIYFIMGPNSLTVVKKATCWKQTKTYNPGELARIDFK